MTQDQAAQIKKIAQNIGLKYLYLFGSQAREKTNRRSDFDFAVKFNTKKVKNTFKAKLKLMSDLSEIVQKEEVDVVNIEEANPLLHFNILRDGKLIYEGKNRAERIMDKVMAMKIYYDRDYYYERHFKQKLNHLAIKGMYE